MLEQANKSQMNYHSKTTRYRTCLSTLMTFDVRLSGWVGDASDTVRFTA